MFFSFHFVFSRLHPRSNQRVVRELVGDDHLRLLGGAVQDWWPAKAFQEGQISFKLLKREYKTTLNHGFQSDIWEFDFDSKPPKRVLKMRHGFILSFVFKIISVQ